MKNWNIQCITGILLQVAFLLQTRQAKDLKMSYNQYIPISKERYDALIARSEKFIKVVDSESEEPVKVFKPLAPELIDELMLIREVSIELQKKKDDDMKKMQGVDTNQEEIKENKVNGSEDIPEKV